MDSAAEGIVGVNLEGRLVMANRSAAELTGYSVADMLGQPAHELLHHSHLNGVTYSVAECQIATALQDGTVLKQQTDVFWRRDGSSFPIEYAIVPTREGDRVTGAVVTFHDISERVAIERMKNQIISVLSHELRTPLAGVRGSLGLVASGLIASDSQRQRMIDLAVENTDRLIRLANEIIDVQVLTNGELQLDRQPVELEQIVAKSVASACARQDATSDRVVQNVESAMLVADPERLIQTLTNLIENAMKFSPADSPVEVFAGIENQEAIFRVRDYGFGIAETQLPSVFNPLEQLDASDTRPRGGLGMGLAISRRIVELHGGHIGVDSTPGQGSTFWFTIPL